MDAKERLDREQKLAPTNIHAVLYADNLFRLDSRHCFASTLIRIPHIQRQKTL